jgi:uncharacterized protein
LKLTERAIFDTNVQISGLLWRGRAYQCLLLARSGVIETFYCQPILAELSEKLRNKFRFSENQLQSVLAEIKRYSQRVEIDGKLRVVHADPDDDKFIECAIVARAGFIVSSDRHLLDLETYQGVKIVSPEEFLEIVLG